MVEAMELDAADPRLASVKAMSDHHDAVRDLFVEAMRKKSLAYWLEQLTERKVPHAPIRDFADVVVDPQLGHRGILVDAPMPAGAAGDDATVGLLGAAYIANEDGPAVSGPPPVLGEHTEAVLTEAGYTPDQIAAMRDDGVFG